MTKTSETSAAQWQLLAKNDWGEILTLSEKKAFQRIFQIVNVFKDLVATQGVYNVSHIELAKKCKISRQLLEHHFPSRTDLVLLTYRYVFAKLQKTAADALVTKKSFLEQFKGYIDSCAEWTQSHSSDALFVIQFYAVSSTDPKLFALYNRNRLMGKERMAALLLKGQAEGLPTKRSKDQLLNYASSIQKLIIGFAVQNSVSELTKVQLDRETAELWRSTLGIVGIFKE